MTVPGAVAGWDALRAKFGKLPMSDLMAPAIFTPKTGFPVSEIIADSWARSRDGWPPSPTPPRRSSSTASRPTGEVFKNPDLGRTCG